MKAVHQPDPFVPLDLWDRLARLDAHCDVHVTRVDGQGTQRQWRVRITGRGRPDWPGIIVDSAVAVDALRIAVREAERRGWDPEPPMLRRALGPLLGRDA